ncbi:hypothetical protein EMCRGX_G025623 [Ephydatia muelleri]
MTYAIQRARETVFHIALMQCCTSRVTETTLFVSPGGFCFFYNLPEHEYVAFPPNDVVVTVTDPPLGLLRDPQSTAIEGEVGMYDWTCWIC